MEISLISACGNIFLISHLLLGLYIILFANKYRIHHFYLSSLMPFLAFLLLVYGFIGSDFRLQNVFLNSSRLMPLIYRISASWANHEGSILLWLSILNIIGAIYIYLSNATNKYSGIVIISFISLMFCSFILYSSNPFDKFSITPSEGLGLNPMLQDIALIIHPPLLYIGNASYLALFVSACLIIHRPNKRRELLLLSKKFSNFALFTLTGGIALGSWWAYRELGWGGFWFFDPVENISLMPWLLGIALHHCLIISIKHDRFLIWTIILSMFNFILILYGTFLVRSGLLSSVHSFAFSKERGIYIFLICTITLLFSVFWFVFNYKKILPLRNSDISTNSEKIILFGNYLWSLSLIAIVFALIYPLYCLYFYGDEIYIDSAYFIQNFIPIFLPILFLCGIAIHIIPDKGSIISIFVSIICTIIFGKFVDSKWLSLAICFCSSWLMIQTIVHVISNLLKGTSLRISMLLAHFSFGMLCISILLNISLREDVEFSGKVGDSIKNERISVDLDDIFVDESKNYYRFRAKFTIEHQNNVVQLAPENRLYKIEETISNDVDIFSFFLYDLYAVLNRIDGDIIYATIYYQPFISYIWISAFLICCSFIVPRIRKMLR